MREIVIDTETTGLNPFEGHRIIEIAAVEMIDKFRTGKYFHSYINPERDISEGAQKVHGIKIEFLKDKPVFQLIALDFLDFIKDSRLVIHNAEFDMKFINHHLESIGANKISIERVTDTLVIARKRYPGAKNNLDALCCRFNIDISARINHGALLDAELLADCYAEMMGAGANQRNLQFAPINNIDANMHKLDQNNVAKKEIYPAREFTVSAEEAANHTEFVEKIKDPLWKLAS